MSSEIDTMTYNQVTGKLITAYFRNNKIYRNDVDGNVQTIYYMQEDDSPEPVGLMSIQSGAATYYRQQYGRRHYLPQSTGLFDFPDG